METETGLDDKVCRTGVLDENLVDLLNHCAICLTHFDSENCKGGRILVEGVSFKHLWSFFLETNGEVEGSSRNIQSWTFVNAMEDEVTTIPPLCLECSEIILELNKRHQAYMEARRFFLAQIKLLRSLLAEEENVQRYKKFQASLEDAEKLDVSWKQTTRFFLESIRRKARKTDDPEIFCESIGDHLDSCDQEEVVMQVKEESIDDALVEDGKCKAEVEYTDVFPAVADNGSTFIDDEINTQIEADADCYGGRQDENNDEDSDYDHYEPSSIDSSSVSGDEEELISIITPQESTSIKAPRQELIKSNTSRRKSAVVKRNIIESDEEYEDQDPLAEISAPSSSKKYKFIITQEGSPSPWNSLKVDVNKCHLCNFVLTPANKKMHYATRHRNHPYNCDICGYNILPEEFPSHLESHVGDYITKCTNSTCSYVAINPQRLWKLHLSRRDQACKDSGQKLAEFSAKCPKKCEYCDLTVKGSSHARLNNHVIDFHEAKSIVKPLSCPVETCDKKFAYRETVQLHLSDHALSTLIFEEQPCSVCYKLYMPPDILTGHLKGFHKFSEIIKCDHCPYVFGTRKYLLDHMCEFHVKTMEGVRCDICKYKDPTRYTKIGHLRAHYYQVHQIGEPLVCDKCGFSTFMELNFHFHKLDHDKYKLHMPKELIKCEMCEEKFISKLKRWVHMRDIHNDKRPRAVENKKKKREYPCKRCDQIFDDYKVMLHHCKSAHPKTHVCESCGKSFKSASAIAIHRKLHEEERPFVCEVCSHAFAQQGDLNSHMRIHTWERPYKCSMCTESFRQRTGLRKHSLTVHNVDKTYVCSRDPSCGKSFTTYKEVAHHEIREHENVCTLCTEERKEFKNRRELHSHLRKFHGKSFSLKCDQCGSLFATQAGLEIHCKKKHKV